MRKPGHIVGSATSVMALKHWSTKINVIDASVSLLATAIALRALIMCMYTYLHNNLDFGVHVYTL